MAQAPDRDDDTSIDTAGSITATQAQTRTFADWVQGEDPAAPVPTCPAWRLADLVDHVGATQRMVAMLVGERLTDPSTAFARQAAAPADPLQWRDWLDDGMAQATAAFASVTDDTPVWDPSGDEDGVRFWSRRLLGEISVHRADAAAALAQPYELGPEPAVAALDDWLQTITSAGYWANRPDVADALRGEGELLHFHATDTAADWVARRLPDEVAVTSGRPETEPNVAVSGPITDLLLVISRRRPLADAALEIQGDRAMFDLWIDHMDWVTDA